ncbi:hypothetical protein PV04_08161 [Phialophora macrospora]|uniref:Heterokaryon incompatibility domain-containing protein n=1 Tax=Phialophora macrospora TaxID=1851006 RepID=A0A0D2FD41_9EURO|nr:hypothetical protein PV04_08161 [Phialophora macrospora]
MVGRRLSRLLPWTLGHCVPHGWGLRRGPRPREDPVTAVSSDSTGFRHVSTKSSEEVVNFLPDDIHTTNLHGNRLEAEEVRMLYLLKNKHPGARIEGLLTRGKLDPKLRYAALSYTCGNPFPTAAPGYGRPSPGQDSTYDQTRKDHHIILNGVRFPVSRNLFEGLARLRNVDRPPGLWVDAICINQGDRTEIEQQVKNMGHIFHGAEEVLVWLGENESENDINLKMALRLVDDIFFAFKHWYDKHRLTRFDEWWENITEEVSLTPDSEDQMRLWELLKDDGLKWVTEVRLKKHLTRADRRAWLALERLLARSWFDRVWTWQEKELARRVRLFIGSQYLSWRKLRLAMLLVMVHDQGRARSETDMLMPGRQYLHVVDNLNIDRAPSLLDMLLNVRHRDCFKKVDKIFGVLGAAAKRETTAQDAAYFKDRVDYNDEVTTPATIYREFSRYFIQTKGDLRVLQACNPKIPTAPRGLPSWVADWSDITLSHQLSSHIYDAARGTNVKARYDPNDFSMTLSGVQVDRVSIACNDARIDALEQLVDESVDWDHWRDAIIETYVKVYVHGTYRGAHKHMAYVGFPSESCWAQLVNVLRAADHYQATGEAVSEAFWRCLMVDKMPGTKMDTKRRIDPNLNVCQHFHNEALRRVLDRGLCRELERDFLHNQKKRQAQPIKKAKRAHGGDGRQHDDHPAGWFGAMQRSVLHKRFFVTEKQGLFGMAPSNVQPGDLVCVLDGGTVPFLLREDGGSKHLRFVEEAYVHGYMDGRAVDEAEYRNGKDDGTTTKTSTLRREFRIC